MRTTGSMILFLLLCVGCVDRQAAKEEEVRQAVQADMKAMGEAMHNDPDNVVDESPAEHDDADASPDDVDSPENDPKEGTRSSE